MERVMKTQLELILLIFYVVRVSGKNCTNNDLAMYSGKVSITNGGRTCQNWSSHSPHRHFFNSKSLFPLDGSVEDANNYCRNVDGDSIAWCYTSDPRKRREYCNKAICGEPVCGGILSEPTGVITSPDADVDGEYDNDVDCLWTIDAPEDRRIEFEVTTIDIQQQQICYNAFIAVLGFLMICCGSRFNANYSQVEKGNETTEEHGSPQDYPIGNITCPAGVDIGLYTGNINVTESGRTCKHWKNTIISPELWSGEDENFCRNFGYVVPWCETIDGKYEYCYEIICKGAACGGNLTTPSGWLSGIDGNHDGNYDVNRECLWTLIAPEDHGIVVQVKFLSIGGDGKCELEKLEIYADASEVNRFCGSALSLPLTLRFKSNLLFVFFKSWFSELPGPGFNLTYVHLAIVSITSPTTEGWLLATWVWLFIEKNPPDYKFQEKKHSRLIKDAKKRREKQLHVISCHAGISFFSLEASEATVSETQTVTYKQVEEQKSTRTTEEKLANVRNPSTLSSSDSKDSGSTQRSGSGCLMMSTSNILSFNLAVIGLIVFST